MPFAGRAFTTPQWLRARLGEGRSGSPCLCEPISFHLSDRPSMHKRTSHWLQIPLDLALPHSGLGVVWENAPSSCPFSVPDSFRKIPRCTGLQRVSCVTSVQRNDHFLDSADTLKLFAFVIILWYIFPDTSFIQFSHIIIFLSKHVICLINMSEYIKL